MECFGREEAWYPVRLRSDRDTVEMVSELGHRETQALLNTGDGLQLSNMCDKSKNGKLNGNVTHTEIKLYPKAIEGELSEYLRNAIGKRSESFPYHVVHVTHFMEIMDINLKV